MWSASFTPVLLLACSTLLSGARGHLLDDAEHSLEIRQDAQCGAGVGSCASGSCCNKKGQCGTGHQFCGGAKNCQVDYSDSCEESRMPTGPSTTDVPRPEIGSVPYGKILKTCSKEGTIALAFDDGPANNFTVKILDLLKSYDMKATFFVTGHDFVDPIDDPAAKYGEILKRMHSEGHQIGQHTWTHENLTALNETRVRNQLVYNEMALRNVLGFIPTYLRPPYLSCYGDCPGIVGSLGYHIITSNLDTKDFDNNDPNLIQHSKDEFVKYMQTNVLGKSKPSVLTLNHDIRLQTAYNLTDYMLNYIATNNLPKSVTVGDCMEDPSENWYRDAGGPLIETATTSSSASASAAKASATGSAGANSENKPNHAGMLLPAVWVATVFAAISILAM